MVAFDARKREKSQKGKNPGRDVVALTIADYPDEVHDADDDDDDDDIRALFVGVASVRLNPFDDDHLLFDSQAGVSLFKDTTHVTDVLDLAKPHYINGICGSDGNQLVAYQEGLFRDFGYVKIAKGAAANILAQCDVHSWGLQLVWDEITQTYTVSGPSHDLEFKLLPGWDAHHAYSLADSKDKWTDIVCLMPVKNTIPSVAVGI